jgi:hypothetical protein
MATACDGTYQGDGTLCDELDCTGACCLLDKSCIITSEIDCVSLRGMYQGNATMCGPDCPEPLATAFTYQGQLKQGGVPLNATVDLEFSLWISPDGDQQEGQFVLKEGVEVENGLFTVQLDFGANVFNGNARCLEVSVCAGCGVDGFVTLAPRQPLTATPYALQTRGLFVDGSKNVGIGTKSPMAGLHLKGTDRPDSFMYLQSDWGRSVGFRLYEGATPKWEVSHSAGTNDFRIDSSDRSNVFCAEQSGGNVGIGTTNPGAKLHIGGTPGTDGLMFPDGTLQTMAATDHPPGNTLDQAYDQGGAGAGRTITADAGAVKIDGPNGLTVNGNVGIGSSGTDAKLTVALTSPTAPGPGVHVSRWTNTNPLTSVRTEIDGNAVNAYKSVFGLPDTGVPVNVNDTSPGDVLLVEGGGDVGIGTDTPTARLHIAGMPGVDGIKFPDGTLQTTAAGGAALVPIGAVIDWWRPNDTFPVPDGFQICTGGVVNDAQSPFNGETLPDLRNRFIRGAASFAGIGDTGGASTHTHTISGATDSKVVTMGPATLYEVVFYTGIGAWKYFARQAHQHLTNPHSHGVGSLDTSSDDHLPPFVGLLKMIRIR